MNFNLPSEQRLSYEEALWTICDLQMRIRELNEEVDDYYMEFDELKNELSE